MLIEKSPKVADVTVRFEAADPAPGTARFVELNVVVRLSVDVVKSIGDTESVRLTPPANPLTLDRVSIEVMVDCAVMLRVLWPGEMVNTGRKSGAPS